MSAITEETGHTYGRLTVIARVPAKGQHIHWLCQCECGTLRVITRHFIEEGGNPFVWLSQP